MRSFSAQALVLSGVLVLSCRSESAGSGGSQDTVGRAPGRHVLLVVEVSSSGARVVDARTVPIPLPRVPSPVGAVWRVEVADAQGEVLFTAAVPAPVSHAEIDDESGGSQRIQIPTNVAVATLRVPWLGDADAVRIRGSQDAILATIPYPRGLP
jgi:hypothetical protein